MKITYLEDVSRGPLVFKEDLLWWQKKGLMFTSTGYGKKIPTTKKVKHENRWYRVYCGIFSNCGSLFIVSKGKNIYLRG